MRHQKFGVAPALKPIIPKAAFGCFQKIQNRPRTVNGRRNVLVKAKAAVMRVQLTLEFISRHAERFRGMIKVHLKIRVDFVFRIAEKCAETLISRNIRQIRERRKNSGLRKLCDACHEEEAKRLIAGFNVSIKAGERFIDLLEEGWLIQMRCKRRIVFVDQENKRRRRQRRKERSKSFKRIFAFFGTLRCARPAASSSIYSKNLANSEMLEKSLAKEKSSRKTVHVFSCYLA